MPIRAGMAHLIARLRGMTRAGSADATLNGVTYFTDEQLQQLLDTTAQQHRHIELIPVPQSENGTLVYKSYAIPAEIPYAFETEAADSGWQLRDAAGQAVTGYSVNYAAGRIEFTSDTGGRLYFLDCRSYNLHQAAAAVWQQKAAFASPDADWQADNHRYDAATVFQHCLQMAALHARLAGPVVAKMLRSDEA